MDKIPENMFFSEVAKELIHTFNDEEVEPFQTIANNKKP